MNNSLKAMKLFPHLLIHPNIPKPLHGLAPRVILGDEWWNKTKAKAKARMSNYCWSCGIHKSQAKYHQWLEAHECFSIDYSIGKVEYVGTAALCHSCHNYIHDGRMLMLVRKEEMSKEKYEDIIRHGNTVVFSWHSSLADYKKPYTPELPSDRALILASNASNKLRWTPGDCKWEDFHMIINGIRYERKFESLESWKKFYNA